MLVKTDHERVTLPLVALTGHSHLNALRGAYRVISRAKGDKALPLSATFVPLRDRTKKTRKGRPRSIPFDNILSTISRSSAQYVASCIGGNTHNLFGLVNHPQPFDFVLPEEPDLPLDPNADILPSDIVRAALRSRMKITRKMLADLRSGVTQPIIHIESPPPVPSEDHIRKHRSVFRAKFEEHGVAPATLRYKLWRLHSSLVREQCQKLGIAFMAVPPSTQNLDGMLVERAWSDDPTHGNVWYGIRVLRRLAKFIDDINADPMAERAKP